MATTNILTLLAADHRMVTKLFTALEQTTVRAEHKRKDLFAQLDQALSTHMTFEESRIYPLLEADRKSKDIAFEAIEEHAQIKRLLAEIRETDISDDHWTAKLTVLSEDVRHHIKEEEGEAFPQLRQIVRASELASLGEAYQATRSEPVDRT